MTTTVILVLVLGASVTAWLFALAVWLGRADRRERDDG